MATTFVPRPPRNWEALTLGLLVAAGSSAGLGLLLLAADLGVRYDVDSSGTAGRSPMVEAIARHSSSLGSLYLVLAFALIWGWRIWSVRTRTVLRAYGDPAGAAAQHWALVAAIVIMLPSIAIWLEGPSGGPTADEISSALLWDAIEIGIRTVALAFLLLAVFQIRGQVRHAVATSGAAPSPADLGLRVSREPAKPLAPLSVAALPDAATLPPADDDFWSRATATARAAAPPTAAIATASTAATAGTATTAAATTTATTAAATTDTTAAAATITAAAATDAGSPAAGGPGAELAVLESTGPLVNRWALIPASGDVTATRRAIPAGAVVTVFAEPPLEGDPADYTPPAAEAYHGFLQDAESGALWYQMVRPNRVPAFLARAAKARRWALYPTDSETASAAVMPG
jgi:hypothetical protein